MKKIILLIVASFVAWVFATPWLTVSSIKSAIREHDGAALAAHIDFPALKQSLRSELSAKLTQTAAKAHGNNPYGNALGAAASQFAIKALDPMIDATLTPETLVALLHGQNGADAGNDGNPGRKGPLESIIPREEIESSNGYRGFDVFIVSLEHKGGGNGALTILLKRKGLFTWKISGVELPDRSR
jgi:hypothetical protein